MTGQRSQVRVVIVHPRDLAAPTLGGIQTFLHDFVKHAPDDFDITVAGVTQDRRIRPIGRRHRVSVDGREAWQLPLAPAGNTGRRVADIWPMIRAQVGLRRLLLDRRTILQIHRPFRRLVLAGQRGPRVQFIHLDIRDWPGPAGWPRLGHLYRPFSDTALERAARVYVVNEPGVALLRAAHPQIADRIEFIPVWFDPQVFRPAQAGERDRLVRELARRLGRADLVADERLILFAGRLEAIKDPDLALAAFRELLRAGRAARLLMAGDGELRARLEARGRELGIGERVDFLGDLSRDELADVMRVCDVLLLTSRTEGGGPRVVLEALACGLPVVATPVGDVARTVRSGANGRLTDGHDAGQVAVGLAWALDQPRDSVAREATAAVAPFTAGAVLAPLYETYRTLATRLDQR